MQLEDNSNTDEPEKSVQKTLSPLKTHEFTMSVTNPYTQPLDTVTDIQSKLEKSHIAEDHALNMSLQTEEIEVKDVNSSKFPCTYVLYKPAII